MARHLTFSKINLSALLSKEEKVTPETLKRASLRLLSLCQPNGTSLASIASTVARTVADTVEDLRAEGKIDTSRTASYLAVFRQNFSFGAPMAEDFRRAEARLLSSDAFLADAKRWEADFQLFGSGRETADDVKRAVTVVRDLQFALKNRPILAKIKSAVLGKNEENRALDALAALIKNTKRLSPEAVDAALSAESAPVYDLRCVTMPLSHKATLEEYDFDGVQKEVEIEKSPKKDQPTKEQKPVEETKSEVEKIEVEAVKVEEQPKKTEKKAEEEKIEKTEEKEPEKDEEESEALDIGVAFAVKDEAPAPERITVPEAQTLTPAPQPKPVEPSVENEAAPAIDPGEEVEPTRVAFKEGWNLVILRDPTQEEIEKAKTSPKTPSKEEIEEKQRREEEEEFVQNAFTYKRILATELDEAHALTADEAMRIPRLTVEQMIRLSLNKAKIMTEYEKTAYFERIRLADRKLYEKVLQIAKEAPYRQLKK